MSEIAGSALSADDAIKKAFEYFDQHFARGDKKPNHVLLEGLEPEADGWVVSIGFDEGRFRETSSTLAFGERTKEPLREIRRFHLSGCEGKLERIS